MGVPVCVHGAGVNEARRGDQLELLGSVPAAVAVEGAGAGGRGGGHVRLAGQPPLQV